MPSGSEHIRAIIIIIRNTTVVMPTLSIRKMWCPKWLLLNTWLMLVRNGSDCPGELRESQCPWALMHVHDRPEDVTGTSPCRPEQSSGQQGVWPATSPGAVTHVHDRPGDLRESHIPWAV